MAKKKKKKSKTRFFIWLVVGIVIGVLAGIAMENIITGFGIAIAFAGFAWVVSGMGMN